MLLLALLSLPDCEAQEAISKVSKGQFIQSWEAARDSIYIVCRGTVAKAGLIPAHFNLQDAYATHVGLGWWDGEGFFVHHVSNEKIPGMDAFRKEKLAAFISGEDVFYISLVAVKDALATPALAAKLLRAYRQQAIEFDFEFEEGNGSYYCSEWVVAFLQKLSPAGLQFTPTKRMISHALARSLLQRDTLTYYPVDFYTGKEGWSSAKKFLFEK